MARQFSECDLLFWERRFAVEAICAGSNVLFCALDLLDVTHKVWGTERSRWDVCSGLYHNDRVVKKCRSPR
jgi:hypothetical protein